MEDKELKSTVVLFDDEDPTSDGVSIDTPPFIPPANDKKVGEMTVDELAYVMNQALVYYHGKEAKGALKEKSAPVENDNVVTSVLKTTGNVLHSFVDIAEGITRGVVDVVTLGKARQ